MDKIPALKHQLTSLLIDPLVAKSQPCVMTIGADGHTLHIGYYPTPFRLDDPLPPMTEVYFEYKLVNAQITLNSDRLQQQQSQAINESVTESAS